MWCWSAALMPLGLLVADKFLSHYKSVNVINTTNTNNIQYTKINNFIYIR